MAGKINNQRIGGLNLAYARHGQRIFNWQVQQGDPQLLGQCANRTGVAQLTAQNCQPATSAGGASDGLARN
eukprot:5643281-Lingulodinium_polyedra.AAC.1